MHGKGGNFCIFLLKIAEKEGKTDEKRWFEKRQNPARYIHTVNGAKLVTRQYSRRSNFLAPMRKGLSMYFCAT